MGQWVAQNTTFLPSVVKERGVWHATNVTCPFFTAYRSPCIDFLPRSCDVRRFLPADYRTETIPCRYLCFLNDIWQKRLRFLTRFRGISRGDFASPFTRNPERRRFRAPAATCYDSKRSLLPNSFLGLKLFFPSWIFILRFCMDVRTSWILITC